MAYDSKGLKAVGGTGGESPKFFTYKSEDTIAEIGAENYFVEAVSLFEAEDIVIVLGFTAVLRIMICATYDLDPDGDHTINFSESGTFVGDVRNTDGVGFKRTNLARVTDGAAPGELFSVYTYRNNSNTLLAISAADYFLEGNDFLDVGDYIYTIGIDGFTILSVESVTDTTVTVLPHTLA